METITVNYWAIVAGAVLSMVIGAIWYGPLFGKKWMEIVGVDSTDLEAFSLSFLDCFCSIGSNN